MHLINRRTLLAQCAAGSTFMAATASFAQTAKVVGAKTAPVSKLSQKLRIVIPANAGGGWDQTGRALGSALLATGSVDSIEYENKGGKGGTLGLAYYAEKYAADPHTLIMGGTVMVGAVALQKPAVDMGVLAPLARLTSDFLVMVVAANSPIKTATDLSVAMKASLKAVPVAGGSAGGVDHIFAGLFARTAGANPEDLVYLPFAGGTEVAAAVLSGKATIGVSGFSEFSAQIASGQLRAIGVSSRKSSFGIPSMRDQGLQLDMANWRGVFTGQAVPVARKSAMVEAIRLATQHEEWKATLKQNRWDASWLAGKDFYSQIDFDQTTARVMVHLLKLKA
ncbi:Bordetella uptake gene [Comamonadaceae bacterium]